MRRQKGEKCNTLCRREKAEFTEGSMLADLNTVSLHWQGKVHKTMQSLLVLLDQHISQEALHASLLQSRTCPAEGFGAAASEHSPEVCVSQDGCRLCSRGCSRVPRAVLQSRSLLCPRGCVPGQGLCRLPGSALHTQHSALSLPGDLPRALWGDVGGKEPPAGQGRAGAFCCHSCCLR